MCLWGDTLLMIFIYLLVHIQITKPPLGHRPSSSMPQQQLTQLQDSPNNSPPSHTSPSSQTSSELCPEVSLSQEVLEIPSIPRRFDVMYCTLIKLLLEILILLFSVIQLNFLVVNQLKVIFHFGKSVHDNFTIFNYKIYDRFDQTIHLADVSC